VTREDGGEPAPVALFVPDGADVFVPSDASSGPWNRRVLHGGAVSALLAGLLENPEQILVRLLVELLGPVPSTPLRAEVGPTEGGRRVVRQAVTLHAGDRPVARALALRMRRGDVDLPEAATQHRIVFDPNDVPDLEAPNRMAASQIGWDSFDSVAMATRVERRSPVNIERTRVWLKLLVPVVPGRPPSPIENVAAAADYGTSGTSGRLDFRTWSFMNADLVVSLSRPPEGDWVALESEGLLSRTGTGQSIAAIHDTVGPLGQSSQSILVEPRDPPT
jgi:hypothetical protein